MAVASAPVQVLRGLYLGVLTGLVPALVAWALGFLFRYVTGITAPAFAVVVLGVALAGVNGGFLALADPAVVGSADAVTVVTALLVVMMASFYAHNRGDAAGASTPRPQSLRALRERTLSADVVDLVGGRSRVRVRVAGQVGDLEGHPPLPPGLRAAVAGFEATLPADLPVSELESRFADRLRAAHDLGDVTVEVDERGRATVAAAPPVAGVSRHVPEGHRAVSLPALVPTGLARGDEVTVLTGETAVTGRVVGARADGEAEPEPGRAAEAPAAETAPAGADTPAADAATTGTPAGTTSGSAGGRGRVSVAVPRAEAATLLGVSDPALVVESRGRRREFELVSLHRRGGGRIRRVTVGADTPLADTTLRAADVRGRHGVVVLAARHDGRWTVAPPGDQPVVTGDELFVAGPRAAVTAFAEVVA